MAGLSAEAVELHGGLMQAALQVRIVHYKIFVFFTALLCESIIILPPPTPSKPTLGLTRGFE